MTRRVLITGGYGYVGGRAAQLIAAQPGTEVKLGTRRPLSAPPAWLPTAKPVTLEWKSPGSLRKACEFTDCVVHLAAMNEIDSADDPVGAIDANAVATLRLIEAALAAGVSRFVYLSTAHVYGSRLAGRVTESTVPRPSHPYAYSHRLAEDIVLAAHDSGRLTGIVLRLSNGFGRPAHSEVERWTLLVNDLCRQATTAGKLVLRSAGLQVRDFITLHDVSRALLHCVDLSRAAAGDGLFNLGGDQPLRVIDMAKIVAARSAIVLGFRPPLERHSPPQGQAADALDYRSDLFQSTGFRLTGNRDEEIDATLRLCHDAFGTAA